MQASEALRAVVTYERGTSVRVRTVTHIRIKSGDETVATATLGGKYSQPQALAEFRRLPGRFTRWLWVRPQQGPAQVA